jgi:TPP-dependent pyruvate/acetoin dehydrogenase alpha subunit
VNALVANLQSQNQLPQATMTTYKQEPAPADDRFSPISNQKLLTLFSTMLQCRRIAENSTAPLKNGRLNRSGNSILGHEAAAVGVAIDLLPGDTIAHALWPEAVLKAINPLVTTTSDISFASRSAAVKKERSNLTILFSSGQRTWQARWKKARSLAADQNLPMIFVSFNTPKDLNGSMDAQILPLKSDGYAFPSINVDGNDVVAVCRVASEAIAHARKHNGPTVIECMVADSVDPLQNMEKYLIRKGLVTRKLTSSLDSGCN